MVKPTEDPTPATEQMQKDVDAIKPGTKIGSAVFAGYVSADFFIQALKKAGANPDAGEGAGGGGEDDVRGEGSDRAHEVPGVARCPLAVVRGAGGERRHRVHSCGALRVHHADVPGAGEVQELIRSPL